MNSSLIQQVLAENENANHFGFYYSIYLYVMLCLSIIPTGIFLFFYPERYTRLRPEYRAFILHAVGVSSFLMIVIALWQPVPLPPLFGGYSLGLLGKLGENGFLLGLWMTWSCMAHLGVIFSFAFLLQSYQLKLFGKNLAFFDWLNEGGNTLKFLNCSAVFSCLIMLVPGWNLLNNILDINSIPELKQIALEHPSTIFLVVEGNLFLVLFCIIGMGVIFLEIVLCFVANFCVYKAIRSTSSLVQASTLSLQMQMHRLLNLRLLVVLLFYYIPVTLIVFIIHQQIQFPIPNFVNYCICMMCWHCPIQIIVQFVHKPTNRRKSTIDGRNTPQPLSSSKDRQQTDN